MTLPISRISKFAAIAIFATSTLMQAAQQASFHLPVEAHWGNSVLAPGDYNIVVQLPSFGTTELKLEHEGKAVFELPLTTDVQRDSDANYLKLENINGQYFVTEFSSGQMGEKFNFSLPRSIRHARTASTPENSVVIGMD